MEALPTINTPRQARFIRALQQSPHSTLDLMEIVAARNVWDVCRQLRKNGWNIETYSEPHIDKDGRQSSIGYYRLLDSIKTSQAALKAWKLGNKKGAGSRPAPVKAKQPQT